MTDLAAELDSVFSLEDAQQLAELASTKRIKCPFCNRAEILLQLLRKAEFAYNKHLYDAEFDKSFFKDGKALKDLANDFHRFKHRWDRTPTCARDEIGYFANDEGDRFAESFSTNEMIIEALELVEKGLKAAVEYRYDNEGGRRDNRPGLKEFAEEIYRGWTAHGGDVPFGDTFEGGIEGDDRIPVSAAAKLVVGAMKILDPEVNARDCETAMRSLKE